MNRVVLQRGVTLIELMAAVAILAVIAAIAVPAYQNYLRTGVDAALKDKATKLRLFEENYRIDNGTYLAGTYNPVTNVNTLIDTGYRVSGDAGDIVLTVTAGNCGDIANCFRVTAEDGTTRRYIWNNGTETWEN